MKIIFFLKLSWTFFKQKCHFRAQGIRSYPKHPRTPPNSFWRQSYGHLSAQISKHVITILLVSKVLLKATSTVVTTTYVTLRFRNFKKLSRCEQWIKKYDRPLYRAILRCGSIPLLQIGIRDHLHAEQRLWTQGEMTKWIKNDSYQPWKSHDPWAILEASSAVFLVSYDVSDIFGRFRSLWVTSLYPGCSLRASKVDQKVVYNTENSGFWISAPDNIPSCYLCFVGSVWHLGHLWNLLFAYGCFTLPRLLSADSRVGSKSCQKTRKT